MAGRPHAAVELTRFRAQSNNAARMVRRDVEWLELIVGSTLAGALIGFGLRQGERRELQEGADR